ncbi:MAG: 3-deoxy-manno-octulosonate cytidylyltransferase [Phycisphaerales bacterium]
MEIVAVIPARFGAQRFPGKPLARETGRYLVEHVWEGARSARLPGRVVVATDDRRILEAVEGFGGEALMTSADHPNGTARINEVGDLLGLGDDAILVNVQGDEPEMEGATVDAAIAALRDRAEVSMSTVASPFADGERVEDPNIVKVVLRGDGCAMYFSRAPIPYPRDGQRPAGAEALKHIGLYAYRRGFLRDYAGWGVSALERCESLEQLRVLDRGHAIAVAIAESRSQGIDTPEQYAAFVSRWRARGAG